MVLVKSQRYWLKWLEREVGFVWELSFDFGKAVNTVPYDIVSD